MEEPKTLYVSTDGDFSGVPEGAKKTKKAKKQEQSDE